MDSIKETQKAKFLIEEVNSRATTFHSSNKKFRKLYIATSIAAVSISALITILTAINTSTNNKWLALFIVALGTTITIISALNAAYSPKEIWLLYYSSLSKMRSLQATIIYKMKDPETILDVHDLDNMFEEYQNILKEHSELYAKVRKASESKGKP